MARSLILALPLALVAATRPAHAAFEFTPPPAPAVEVASPAPAAQAVEMTAPAEQVAMTPGADPRRIVDGFGQGVTVQSAVSQIAPSDVQVAFAPGVDRAKLVNWSGGRPWPDVLSDAMAQAGLIALVGPGLIEIRPLPVPVSDTQVAQAAATAVPAPTAPAPVVMAEPAAPAPAPVVAAPAPAPAPAVAAPAPAPATAAPVALTTPAPTAPTMAAPVAAPVMAEPAPLPAPAPAPEPVAPKLWNAAAGQTLRQVLIGWGEEAGWSIAWQSELDYPLAASASFAGSFEDASKALLDAFAKAEPPVLATLYRGNNVVVVTTGAQ